MVETLTEAGNRDLAAENGDARVRREPSSRVTRPLLGIVAAAVAALAIGAAPLASQAAPPASEIGVFPTWSVSGASGAFQASASFPDSANFPATTVTTTSTTAKAPTGESAWLGSSTAFGQQYGSSRSQPYLYLSTAAGQSNSVTHITFDDAPPADWGFALGDVDADWVFVQAWQDAAKTIPVPVDGLGFQGAANYCNNVPKPSSCTTPPFTDAPVWVTAPEEFDGTSYVPGTLRGNSLPGAPAASRDTSGAYGWFTPTATIRAIDLTFGRRDGLPIYQLWLAALAPKATLAGTVVIPGSPESVPPGTEVQLNDASGEPILDIENQPVVTPVAADGSFQFETEQREAYEIAVIPPPGFEAPEPVIVQANSAEVFVAPITMRAEAVAPPTSPRPPVRVDTGVAELS